LRKFLAGLLSFFLISSPAYSECGKGPSLHAALASCVGKEILVIFNTNVPQVLGTLVDATEEYVSVEHPNSAGKSDLLIIPYRSVLYFERPG